MIAGAVMLYLRAQGLSPVRLATLGDYTAGAGAVWAVFDEAGGDVSRLDRSVEWYAARLQVRARSDDMVRAVAACRQAYDLIRAARGMTLTWTDPITAAVRQYQLMRVNPFTRPTWIPTRAPGEMATSNYDLRVREI